VSNEDKTINETFTVEFEVKEATWGITLDKESIGFDEVFSNYIAAPAAVTVTVTNTGNQPTEDLTIVLSEGSKFTLSGGEIESIAPNAAATFTVQPVVGLAAGEYSATVTVGNARITENNSFNVSFTVIALGSGGVDFVWLDQELLEASNAVFKEEVSVGGSLEINIPEGLTGTDYSYTWRLRGEDVVGTDSSYIFDASAKTRDEVHEVTLIIKTPGGKYYNAVIYVTVK
jgi:hypothetical protein